VSDKQARPDPGPAYLGDGVYVRVDHGGVVLSVIDHRQEVVTLEPEVVRALLRYMDRAFGREYVLNLVVPAEIFPPSP
jgi:hypothetical protein